MAATFLLKVKFWSLQKMVSYVAVTWIDLLTSLGVYCSVIGTYLSPSLVITVLNTLDGRPSFLGV